ncbi:hypothetical protein [Amphibacillus cookii]|uniref:hypothetical protein n=1 Tax=Amphibacillus cookii TaxID=767787 RepID=UPI0019576086|nr:hypothetical protein [Amphibacillus cookii]MBM7540419.1 multidrug efflux pump subunit AcrA (membrane-fusion protein) [Amphibacillus cookii]
MKLYQQSELKDSRIFFDKRPPRFMSLFIIFLVFFLIGSVSAAHLVKRPYVVKAQGTVVVEGTGYLSTKTQGVITQIHAHAGDYVEVGDPIIGLSSGNEGLQAAVVAEQILDLEETLDVMDKYEQALNDQDNIMKQTGKELEYYGKVAYYLDTIKQEDYEANKASEDLSEKHDKINQLKKEISSIEAELQQAKQEGEQTETNQTQLNQQLVDKQQEQEQLLTEITDLERQEDIDYDSLTEKQDQLEQINRDLEKYQNQLENSEQEQVFEQVSQLEGELDMKQSEVEGLSDEIKQLEEQSDAP